MSKRQRIPEPAPEPTADELLYQLAARQQASRNSESIERAMNFVPGTQNRLTLKAWHKFRSDLILGRAIDEVRREQDR